jgi:hypothetical protein
VGSSAPRVMLPWTKEQAWALGQALVAVPRKSKRAQEPIAMCGRADPLRGELLGCSAVSN